MIDEPMSDELRALSVFLAASKLVRTVDFLIDGHVRFETTMDRMCRYRLEQLYANYAAT